MRRRWRVLGSVVALALVAAGGASAQVIERPADRRPELEPFEGDEPQRGAIELPPIPSAAPDQTPLSAGLTIEATAIRVDGSTVFSAEELDEITAPWQGRAVDSAELADLVDAVTQRYASEGYVTSSAFLPDQDLLNGVLIVRVVEASLADVRVEGNERYRERYLRRRLQSAVPTPLSVLTLEEQLQVLLQDPGIGRVDAELLPGSGPGENVLVLRIEEARGLGGRLRVANDNPPSIGGVRGYAILDAYSPIGVGDGMQAWFGFAEGLDSQELRYSVPVLARGTELAFEFRRNGSNIVEEPFDRADIGADTWTIGAVLRDPVIRTPRTQLWLSAAFDRRRSVTFLAGEPFSFVPGPDDGQSDVTVLRFAADYTWRSRADVIAARSSLSWGFDALGATVNSDGAPDGKFVSWLAQVQWARRLSQRALGTLLVVRGDLQLASDPLLSLEQIAVGGFRTVRGYRENLLVRDSGALLSAELRIPILPNTLGRHSVEFGPFIDYGRSWNVSGPLPPENIASAGVGLRYAWSDRIDAYLYWGGAFEEFEFANETAQDDGVHIGVTLRAF